MPLWKQFYHVERILAGFFFVLAIVIRSLLLFYIYFIQWKSSAPLLFIELAIATNHLFTHTVNHIVHTDVAQRSAFTCSPILYHWHSITMLCVKLMFLDCKVGKKINKKMAPSQYATNIAPACSRLDTQEMSLSQLLADAGHHCSHWLVERAFPSCWDGGRKCWSAGTWWQNGSSRSGRGVIVFPLFNVFLWTTRLDRTCSTWTLALMYC